MGRTPIEVVFRRGVCLPEADVWLDPWDGRERAFVSHAHSDHVAPHQEILCSSVTADFLAKRFRPSGTILPLAFGEVMERGGFRFRLHPAGHILGSAQLHVERIRDGASLLYTGDFKLRPGLSSEAAEPVAADTLIMETTYGLPRYRFPPADAVLAQMTAFAADSLAEGAVPMFAAYSLGKAQELMLALGQRRPEWTFILHDSAARMTTVYEEMGYPIPPWEKLGASTCFAGKVVIAPPSAIRSQQLRKVRPRVTAMVSGWGIDPAARFRYQVDEVFPLSDHADYDDLLRYVGLVNPAQTLTLHGFASEFARDLRSRGREAWALTGHNQLELFSRDGVESRDLEAAASVPADGEFAVLAAMVERLRDLPGKTAKVLALAESLRGLDDGRISLALTFLSGRPFGRTEGVRTPQVGWVILRRALSQAAGLTEAEVRAAGVGQNDGPRTVRLCLEGRVQPRPWMLAEVRGLFESLAEASGPLEKTRVLAEALRQMHPSEAALLAGILGGELRIGVQQGMLEEALARAREVPVGEIRHAHMLLGDLGATALLARGGSAALRQAGVTPFVPVACMLASPAEAAGEIWERLCGQGEVWLEDKFDGIRAQLHKAGDRVEIFSRDLRPLHFEFPDLVEPARRHLGADVVLDGEIVAHGEGRRLTFHDLQKRLGRKRDGDLFFGPEVPVRFVVFDLLWKDGETLLHHPLVERRSRLEGLSLGAPFEPLAVVRARSEQEIEEAFQWSRRRGNEGLIAKDGGSSYAPGRRGMAWLKLKKAMTTLDCVVVRAEEGHGKRSHVLSDYTFAVRDEPSGRLVILGKAYSGLSDAEIEELTEHFLETTLSKRRRVREVVPEVVLEIAFDSIRPSQRHDSGLALRFPRIKAIRRDKTAAEIDTLATAQKLAGLG
ncbi:MAG: DNA ligase-1 [Verrucomicrobia bacterium]|jgi:DNA ligase-1|nr:MAG: DNA ligase-1 [Verrucomicrobiota bacterium]